MKRGKRLKQQVENGSLDELSMGAQVIYPACSICRGSPMPSVTLNEDYPGEDVRGHMHFVASLVQAPTCTHCGTSMKAVSNTTWACPNDQCEGYNQPLNTGVYPVQRVVEDG